jgi:hypothetical protein
MSDGWLLTTSTSDSDYTPDVPASPVVEAVARRRVGRRRGALIQLRTFTDLSVLTWFDPQTYIQHLSDERHWIRMGRVKYNVDHYTCTAQLCVSPFLKRVLEWKLQGYPFDMEYGPVKIESGSLDNGRLSELLTCSIKFKRHCWRYDLRETIMGDLFDMLLRVGNYDRIFEPVHRFIYGTE